ncbi:MAG: DUF413 domain-containing protein [Planctomycetes bacterium]|nr:DUF413 domain-containing protein [Planctomycetota bacterium]
MKSKTSRNMNTEQVQPFVFRCSTSVFHPDEIEALLEQGNVMEALAAGTVRPTTAEQKHFLLVDCEEAEPRSIAERAWVRLKARREFEQGEKEKAPPSPPQDYGMVEFDADRCWW